jgi:beta-N-acetylglucosaminidase
VIDYPDFLGRAYLFARWNTAEELDLDLARLEAMSLFKMNKVYAGYSGAGKVWHRPDGLFEAGVAEAGRRCRENGVMTLGLMVNPYAHFEFEPASESLSDEIRYVWTHGSEESLERLRQAFKIGLDAGARTIMLLADDHVPHEGRNRKNFSLYTAEDKRRFTSLQHAQAHVINRLKAWIDQAYPGTRFEFCPPWYANEFIDRSEGKAEIYFRELAAQIPQDIAVIWTGPTVRSLAVDMADLRRYQDLIGRRPMFWDNTLYARNLETRVYGGYTTHYPGKVRMCNLFEPLDGDRPPEFQDLNDGRHIFVNGAAYTEIYAVKFATVADYEWNTAAYNPERSLWKALSRAFGPSIGREILFFNDAYYGLYDVCMWLERVGVTPELIRKGETFLRRLQELLASVRRLLPAGHPLPGELEELQARQEKRFEKLSRGAPAER